MNAAIGAAVLQCSAARSPLLLAMLLMLPISPVLAQQAPPSRTLQVGAQARARVPKIAPEWIDGTVVAPQATPTCLAIRLEHTDGEGRQQYVFLAGVKELKVDRRTNQGVLTAGLPPAAEADWDAWTPGEIATAAAKCRRS